MKVTQVCFFIVFQDKKLIKVLLCHLEVLAVRLSLLNNSHVVCELRFNLRGGSDDQGNTILADYFLDVKPCTKRLLLIGLC